MIRKTEDDIKQLESQYPGITEQIWRFEQADLPACMACGSADTASVQVGVMGARSTSVRRQRKFTSC